MFRFATGADAPVLAHFFHAMLHESDLLGSGVVANWHDVLTEHFRVQIESGATRCFVAEEGGQIVATASISLRTGNGDIFLDRSATLWGVYVAAPFRRRGIARALVQRGVAWCREGGFASIRLQTSREGRPLYESLGFSDGDEMRLKLR